MLPHSLFSFLRLSLLLFALNFHRFFFFFCFLAYSFFSLFRYFILQGAFFVCCVFFSIFLLNSCFTVIVLSLYYTLPISISVSITRSQLIVFLCGLFFFFTCVSFSF